MTDLVITLNRKCNIEFVHALEQALDKSLLELGFTRTGTSHNDANVEIEYFQFAIAIDRSEEPYNDEEAYPDPHNERDPEF